MLHRIRTASNLLVRTPQEIENEQQRNAARRSLAAAVAAQLKTAEFCRSMLRRLLTKVGCRACGFRRHFLADVWHRRSTESRAGEL
jgi:hypothetical protein